VRAQKGTCSWFWASLQIAEEEEEEESVDLLLDGDLEVKSRGAPLRALTKVDTPGTCLVG